MKRPVRDGAEGCAAIGAALGEPLAGSAPVPARWLVLEVPGAWGHDALRESDLHPALAQDLAARAEALGIRVQVVRRSQARYERARPIVQLACLEPGRRFLEEVELRGFDALAALDLERFAAGEPTGSGRLLMHRRWLVCTHGTKDPCCAALGRPLHRALDAQARGRVWHSAHLGGDRFAANVCVLPDGLLFGRVPAARASELRAAIEDDGALPLDLLRGRAGTSQPVQAAEHHARAAHGVLGLDAVDVVDVAGQDDDGVVVVTLDLEAVGRVEVRLRHEDSGTPRPTSCKPDEEKDPGAWRPLALRTLARA